MPIYRARQWTLQHRMQVTLKADPITALSGNYIWIKRSLPSNDFYTKVLFSVLGLVVGSNH